MVLSCLLLSLLAFLPLPLPRFCPFALGTLLKPKACCPAKTAILAQTSVLALLLTAHSNIRLPSSVSSKFQLQSFLSSAYLSKLKLAEASTAAIPKLCKLVLILTAASKFLCPGWRSQNQSIRSRASFIAVAQPSALHQAELPRCSTRQ